MNEPDAHPPSENAPAAPGANPPAPNVMRGNARRSSSRGKWLAAALLILGLLAGLAEWKFRPRLGPRTEPIETQPRAEPGANPADPLPATPP